MAVDFGLEAIGFAAGALTSLSFLPQAFKSLRSKSTHDLSLPAFSALALGTVLWFSYGLALGSLAIMATNAVTFAFAAAIILAKIRYG